MKLTAKEIEKSISICGLVCALCSENVNCSGCKCKDEDCSIKKCSSTKKLNYCFECNEFPCNEGIFCNVRLRAFNRVAKEEGVEKFAEYLKKNYDNGITYHRNDGLKGDYDVLTNENDIMLLLKTGKVSPYIQCPIYESESFTLRLVNEDDANDLLKCYSDHISQTYFNDDNCSSHFVYTTLEEMQNCIKSWIYDYQNQNYVRFAIVDKSIKKAVGTIEIFGGEYCVLRIDIASEYENKSNITQLIKIADSFYSDFGCINIVTKIPEGECERKAAFIENSYKPYHPTEKFNRNGYYIKNEKD